MPKTEPASWYDRAAWEKVVAFAATQGIRLDPPAGRKVSPVERARRMAELAAPLDMMQSLALGHGTDPEVLERDRAAHRLRAELCHKRLSIVGLKSGEIVENDLSDRFQSFLTSWLRRPKRGEAGE
jgi:hypothetical protein